MLPSWCNDSVTVVRAPIVTERGREQRDWANARRFVVRGCSLQPSTTETSFDGARRDPSESTATLICPYGADVSKGDRVIDADGRSWLVDGVPMGVRSPTGMASNLKVTLREWRG